jgi:hypothetical protein
VSEIQPAADPGRSALIAEATKRAGLVWISVPGQGRPHPAWHIWASGAAYLVTGPGEQPLPGLREPGQLGEPGQVREPGQTAEPGQVTVTVPSKDSGGSLITWTAEVSTVRPGSAEWDAVSSLLAAGRLNAALEPGEISLAERWARTAVIFRLSPTGPR